MSREVAIREVELKAGVNLIIKAEFFHYETEGDVWESRVAENKSWVKITFELTVNGKTLTTENYHDGFMTHENGKHINHADMLTIIFGSGVVVGLTAANKAKVMDAIESLKTEVTPAGVETEEEKVKREKEGFLPKVWTVEDYEEAKAILGRK